MAAFRKPFVILCGCTTLRSYTFRIRSLTFYHTKRLTFPQEYTFLYVLCNPSTKFANLYTFLYVPSPFLYAPLCKLYSSLAEQYVPIRSVQPSHELLNKAME